MTNTEEKKGIGIEKELYSLSIITLSTLICLVGILAIAITFAKPIKEHLVWFHPIKFRLLIHLLSTAILSYTFVRFKKLLDNSLNSKKIGTEDMKAFRTSQLCAIGLIGGIVFFIVQELAWLVPQIPSIGIKGFGFGMVSGRLFSTVYKQKKMGI